MEKIKKNLHIIIILLLLIISTLSIFLNIKFNKKNIKIKAEEIPSNYISYNATLNEDLSGKNIRFNIDFIKNLTTEDINNWSNEIDVFNRETPFAIYQQLNNNLNIIEIILEKNVSGPAQITAKISIITNNDNNSYETIYYAYKSINGRYGEIYYNEEKINYTYITTSYFNNLTTASQDKLNYWNTWANKFILMEEEITINAPSLSSELNTLIWNNIDNATYELYKDNQLLINTNNNRYVAISNGTYKVRAVINGKYSDFSNEIIINDIEENGQYTFLTLFGNLVDSQLYLIQSMLNFEILGFNLYQLFTALLTLCIIIVICKIALFK